MNILGWLLKQNNFPVKARLAQTKPQEKQKRLFTHIRLSSGRDEMDLVGNTMI